jgi:hypothetical protein
VVEGTTREGQSSSRQPRLIADNGHLLPAKVENGLLDGQNNPAYANSTLCLPLCDHGVGSQYTIFVAYSQNLLDYHIDANSKKEMKYIMLPFKSSKLSKRSF